MPSHWETILQNFVLYPTVFNWNDLQLFCKDLPQTVRWPQFNNRELSLLEAILLLIPNVAWNKPDELYHSIEFRGLIRQLFAVPSFQEGLARELTEPLDLAAALKRMELLRADMHAQLDRTYDGELYPAAFMDVIRASEQEVRRRHAAIFTKAKARCARYKEELIAAAWAPARVERWVEAGIDLEAL